ncbi:ParB/RepB/Spo0J family partition protein [Cytobacillus massiliigabonensis]|uniref:ParB/RepB/Spo0J family partition protein n=1 Tax=Cytobacillus massiliigabonensis TaxID=1871011 RepID=UPI0015E149F4|nr:ParB N-terminal domain-containing protein [Cytobacillus massiliigabonensis]
MSGKIAIGKLKEHPKNSYYFTDISGEKFEEVKRSIDVNGIRDPIKCTTAFTVISGHQRLRIAKELGLTRVPVEILDVDEWQAEYLLIAENVERRGQAETDPIKKARIAQFLKEYWGVRSGGNGSNQFKQTGHNGQVAKTTTDIAESIGESEKTTRRLMKLNDLIPEIQTLVSEGIVGTTAAEQYAYITPENQRILIEALGEKLGEKSVVEAKEIRKQSEQEGDFEEVLKAKESELEDERKRREQAERSEKIALQRLEEAEKRPYQVVEREVVKEVVPPEVQQQITENQRKYEETERERRLLEQSLSRTYERIEHLEKLEKTVRVQEESPMYDLIRSLQTSNRYFDTFTLNEKFTSTTIASAEQTTVDSLETQLRRTLAKVEHVLALIDERNGVIVIDQNISTEVVVND